MEKDFLLDRDFLIALDNERNKCIYVRIIVLDRNELPIQSIEGRVQPGSSINIDGSSLLRRTASISFVAEEGNNNLTNIDNLLSLNKKVKLEIGVVNTVNPEDYGEVCWFNQGIYVITNPSLTHNTSSVSISLNLKDKMCLLNGSSGGELPTSVTFSSYKQVLEDGSIETVPQLFYDIIETAVMNYGGEAQANIVINDVPLELKQIVHWTNTNQVWYNPLAPSGGNYTLIDPKDTTGAWKAFDYGDEIGYEYVDFIYPQKTDLITGIGENVASVIDKVQQQLGNYECFYDVNGRFIFQEKKNYLNTTYDATVKTRLDNLGKTVYIPANNLSIIDNTNYQVDFCSQSKSVYTFSEGSGLISAYNNSINYENIKNDFHIWGGTKDGSILHYHLVIKDKPVAADFGSYRVVKVLDKNNEETGKIRLATVSDNENDIIDYTPNDWRAELYMRGLVKNNSQIRPDIYEQELLDLFDDIYNMAEKSFKTDLVKKPNELRYFIDFLEPNDYTVSYSVDSIGTRVKSYQQEAITRLYNMDIPNLILIDTNDPDKENKIKQTYQRGETPSIVNSDVYKYIAEGMSGYSANDVARDLLYQYTNYNESISLSCIPIYYLEPNTRITVHDNASNIHGDYIIQSINLPIGGNVMTINATRALERDNLVNNPIEVETVAELHSESNSILIKKYGNLIDNDDKIELSNNEGQEDAFILDETAKKLNIN